MFKRVVVFLLSIVVNDNGKPFERMGRKVSGLRLFATGCRTAENGIFLY